MKTVIVGVTGGIAAFKSAQLVSDLVKKEYDVYVLMSAHAKEFVGEATFAALSKHPVYDMFDTSSDGTVKHIELAKKADAFLIVPASANVIAKVAHGIADDMLTTTFLAHNKVKIIAPAMNTQMYMNPVTQRNLKLCRDLGYTIVEPGRGRLACGDVGSGKLADVQDLMDTLEQLLWDDRCLKGKHILVTAGATQEAMDPVRYISNHSSGKMGFAIAKMAKRCGANVTLIAGVNHLPGISGITYVPVVSARDMEAAVLEHLSKVDAVVKAAAVADYRPANVSEEKMKKSDKDLVLPLVKNPDILMEVAKHKRRGQVICGFAMETENVLENAKAKLIKKDLDMMVVNDLREHGAGFQVDSNRVTILTKDRIEDLPLMSKEAVGYELCKRIAKMLESER